MIPDLEDLQSNPDSTCPICDAVLRRFTDDPCGMVRCDACEISFTSPEADEMQQFADELNAEHADEIARCRVCGCAEYDAGFQGCHWVPDPQGQCLCNRCA